MITMGMKLRQLRKQNGYRQSDISDIIGCERQALSQYENDKNKPSKEKLNKLAELYKVDINYLKYDEQNLGALLEYRLVNEMGVRNLTEEEKNEIADKINEIYKIIKQEEEHNLFFFTCKEREYFIIKKYFQKMQNNTCIYV